MLLDFLIVIFGFFIAWCCSSLCLKDSKLNANVNQPEKYWQIDGIRFFLAFSVFLCHSFIIRDYLDTHIWNITPEHNNVFIEYLGQGSVALFFIITSFLFWDKALNKPNQFNTAVFFIGRIHRLYPVYLLVVIIFILIAAYDCKDIDQDFLIKAAQLLALGYFGNPDFSCSTLSPAYIGQFWTLQYEWKFYLILPFFYTIFYMSNYKRIILYLCIAYIVFCLSLNWYSPSYLNFYGLFCIGIFCATLHNSGIFNNFKISQNMTQFLFLFSIFGNIFIYDTNLNYLRPLLYLITFLSLLNLEKNTFLGLILNSQPSRLLGASSYAVYMIHGFVISIISLIFYNLYGSFSFIILFLFCTTSTIILTLLSISVYKYIELPYAFKKAIPLGVDQK